MGINNEPKINSAYSAQEAERISRLFGYFDDYLEQQDYYEFFYSKKRGLFFSIAVQDSLNEEYDGVVKSADSLFQRLVNDVCDDIISPRLATQIGGYGGLLPLELAEAKRRLASVLEKMDDSEKVHYGEIAETVIEQIQSRNSSEQ